MQYAKKKQTRRGGGDSFVLCYILDRILDLHFKLEFRFNQQKVC